MANVLKFSADRLLGIANVSGADLPDLAEEEVFRVGDSGWPRHDAKVWVNSLALDEDRTLRPHAAAPASAPVKVPVWPGYRQDDRAIRPVGMLRTGEEEEGRWLPPHEFLAREKERSAATSVLEGAGRTLKGRDMSRLRDAVWSRTSFFG